MAKDKGTLHLDENGEFNHCVSYECFNYIEPFIWTGYGACAGISGIELVWDNGETLPYGAYRYECAGFTMTIPRHAANALYSAGHINGGVMRRSNGELIHLKGTYGAMKDKIEKVLKESYGTVLVFRELAKYDKITDEYLKGAEDAYEGITKSLRAIIEERLFCIDY